MSVDQLMSGVEGHWTDEALCDGDSRFTQPRRLLTSGDFDDMRFMCSVCPVIERCEIWAATAVPGGVTDVWATGFYRQETGVNDE
ncbi:WhiB family transcription factor [Mycobacterium phage Aegeus]|nr:WhiB family transcription factor [Mycobacterium phage Baudelaire]WKW86568.1 WhiB family transcription factor [Mycobacterium phage Aegeus]